MRWEKRPFAEALDDLFHAHDGPCRHGVAPHPDPRWTLPDWLATEAEHITWLRFVYPGDDDASAVFAFMSNYDVNTRKLEPVQVWVGRP